MLILSFITLDVWIARGLGKYDTNARTEALMYYALMSIAVLFRYYIALVFPLLFFLIVFDTETTERFRREARKPRTKQVTYTPKRNDRLFL